MEKTNWRMGFGAALLAAACAVSMSACEDDDSGDDAVAEETGGGTVATNVVPTTNANGTVSLVTNLVFIPNPVTNFVLKLPAPALIGPADGAEWALVPGAQGATVKFEWVAVAGADGYQLAYKRPTDGDFMTLDAAASPAYGQYPRGTNFWKLAAVVGGTPQAWSETRSFIFK